MLHIDKFEDYADFVLHWSRMLTNDKWSLLVAS